jgi:hypothetical protein
MMSENLKPMSAEDVAQAFLEGLLRKRYLIFPGGSGFIWRMNRFFPWLVRWVNDREYHQARRKLGKE